MFIWDFVADTVLGQIIDWLYGQIVGFLGDFFMQMGSMGAELFEMSWVQSVVLLFSYLAWALYVTGIVVAAFECGIEYQNGRGSIRDSWQPACLLLFQWNCINSVFPFREVLQLVLQDWEKILGQLRQGLCSLFRMPPPGRRLPHQVFLVESE